MSTALRAARQYTRTPSRRLSTIVSETPSTVHRGTAFEELSLRLLHEHLSMSLRRVGGKDDGGIDLQGWWWLPPPSPSSSPTRIRVLAQCKAEKKKAGPKYVREMEGVLHRYLPVPVQMETDRVVGLLISSSPFTKAALLRAHSSALPLMLLHLPLEGRAELEGPAVRVRGAEGESLQPCAEVREVRAEEASIGSLVVNQALGSSTGILRGILESRWEYNRSLLSGGRPGLWMNGQRLTSWIPETSSQL